MSAPSPFPAQLDLKRPVCVFCGSSPGFLPLYTIAAESVGQALADANIPLVYGGGRRGIMGVVSQACLKAGGHVHGIVPHALTERASEHTPAPAGPSSRAEPALSEASNQSKEGSGETVLTSDDDEARFTTDVVGSMHERKHKMAKLSQGGFIVLPGGYGTFEEALEMTTWNQLGIHRLPVIILNVGNFYSHLQAQILSAVDAGFISSSNLSLCRFVNLEGGETDNADESKAAEWGAAAVKALEAWQLDENTGYNLDWELKDKRAGGGAGLPHESTLSALAPARTINSTPSSTLGEAPTRTDGSSDGRTQGASSSISTQPESKAKAKAETLPPAIFTTMRFTDAGLDRTGTNAGTSASAVTRSSVPLLGLHVQRLKEAHDHFATRDGRDVWGEWVGEEVVWEALRGKLEENARSVGRGDWRVRVVLHPITSTNTSTRVEVQVLPAPKDAGPFMLYPHPHSHPHSHPHPQSPTRRPLVIDPEETEFGAEVDLRLYKTTSRAFYDAAYERGGALLPTLHPEVLLHTPSHILETTTSNIAILPASLPPSGAGAGSSRSHAGSEESSEDEMRSQTDIDGDHGSQSQSRAKWLTPRLSPSTPFLDGVMRRHLLSQGVLEEAELSVQDVIRCWTEGGRIVGFNGLRGVWEAELVLPELQKTGMSAEC